MENQLNRQDVYRVCLLTILFGGSSLTSLGDSLNPIDPNVITLRYFLMGASFSLLLLSSRFNQRYSSNQAIPLKLTWIFLALASLIFDIIRGDLFSFRDSLWMLVGVPIIFFYSLPRLMGLSVNLLIALAIIFSSLFYIFVSLVFYPIAESSSSYASYSGIFPNPNQLGFISATMACGIFIILSAILSEKKTMIDKSWRKLKIFILALLLLLSFSIILVANARTSLITCLAMTILLSKDLMKNTGILIATITSFFAISVATLFLLPSEHILILFSNINNIHQKEGLSGREEIWAQTLSDANLIGHGSDYFEDTFGLGAHNTIVSTLGHRGIIALLLMLILIIVNFYYAYSYLRSQSNNPYASAPLLITTGFWSLSMGEGMFGALGNSMTMAYLLSMGVVMTNYYPIMPILTDRISSQKLLPPSSQRLLPPSSQRFLPPRRSQRFLPPASREFLPSDRSKNQTKL